MRKNEMVEAADSGRVLAHRNTTGWYASVRPCMVVAPFLVDYAFSPQVYQKHGFDGAFYQRSNDTRARSANIEKFSLSRGAVSGWLILKGEYSYGSPYLDVEALKRAYGRARDLLVNPETGAVEMDEAVLQSTFFDMVLGKDHRKVSVDVEYIPRRVFAEWDTAVVQLDEQKRIEDDRYRKRAEHQRIYDRISDLAPEGLMHSSRVDSGGSVQVDLRILEKLVDFYAQG